MSKYSPLYNSIWNDNQFEEYSPEKKLLFIFLSNNQEVNKSGIYKITIRQIQFYTGIDKKLINDFINELINEQKLKYDFDKGIIFIKNVYKYQKGMIKNQNIMLLSIKRQYELVTTDFWEDFLEIYKEDKTIKFFINEVINGSLIDHQLYINKDINKDKDISKDINKEEKPKKTKTTPKPAVKEIIIPNFVDTETWNNFVNMRKEIKKPLTDSIAAGCIKNLTKFEDIKAGNANLALENSIAGGYQGLFEPKTINNFNNNSRLGF